MASECFCDSCVDTRQGIAGLICNVIKRKRRLEDKRRRERGPNEMLRNTTQAHLGVYTDPHRWGGWMNNQIKRELLRQHIKRQKPPVGERREPRDTHEK